MSGCRSTACIGPRSWRCLFGRSESTKQQPAGVGAAAAAVGRLSADDFRTLLDDEYCRVLPGRTFCRRRRPQPKAGWKCRSVWRPSAFCWSSPPRQPLQRVHYQKATMLSLRTMSWPKTVLRQFSRCLGLGLASWCLGLGLGLEGWCLGLGLEGWCLESWCLGAGLGLEDWSLVNFTVRKKFSYATLKNQSLIAQSIDMVMTCTT